VFLAGSRIQSIPTLAFAAGYSRVFALMDAAETYHCLADQSEAILVSKLSFSFSLSSAHHQPWLLA
jgi:hypothetical protein